MFQSSHIHDSQRYYIHIYPEKNSAIFFWKGQKMKCGFFLELTAVDATETRL